MTTKPFDSGSDPLAARDRLRRARTLAMSPAERMEAMWQLIAKSWAVLERNPQGREHFLRRNFRARAIRTQRQGRVDDV